MPPPQNFWARTATAAFRNVPGSRDRIEAKSIFLKDRNAQCGQSQQSSYVTRCLLSSDCRYFPISGIAATRKKYAMQRMLRNARRFAGNWAIQRTVMHGSSRLDVTSFTASQNQLLYVTAGVTNQRTNVHCSFMPCLNHSRAATGARNHGHPKICLGPQSIEAGANLTQNTDFLHPNNLDMS